VQQKSLPAANALAIRARQDGHKLRLLSGTVSAVPWRPSNVWYSVHARWAFYAVGIASAAHGLAAFQAWKEADFVIPTIWLGAIFVLVMTVVQLGPEALVTCFDTERREVVQARQWFGVLRLVTPISYDDIIGT
jgi:hypothetical protein